ncbi:hypothetical protein FQA39_LY02011 [Lamprigera yunnana]|nr:hypothetical protein FQA39_LY02011 [Lamprigera yunnana]
MVDLGFAEECEPWRLKSCFFPSKIGGKPAWLDYDRLPAPEDLQCGVCSQPMIFLCQIYAPYEDDENNFHRILFIFICRSSNCCVKNANSNVKVFRSHLCRTNRYYSIDPPIDEPHLPYTLPPGIKLCNLCGCAAKKHCSKCKAAYCCREHQVIHWKEIHRMSCNKEEDTRPSKLLFTEFELLIEEEVVERSQVEENKALEEYKQLENEGKLGTMAHVNEVDIEAHASVDQDIAFSRFRKRIARNSDQVLRYERDGTPLWIAIDPKPLQIPDCEYCNAPRQFEFQIMPQMLSVLNENVLDWGVLVVYSCKNSCTNEGGYKTEFVFKQDVSNNIL